MMFLNHFSLVALFGSTLTEPLVLPWMWESAMLSASMCVHLRVTAPPQYFELLWLRYLKVESPKVITATTTKNTRSVLPEYSKTTSAFFFVWCEPGQGVRFVGGYNVG